MHEISASLIRLKAEEDLVKKEEEKARREFIRNEYMRKKQLKLMDDMDSVVKPRPPGVKQKKPRPKSMHRDIMESPKPPARTATGTMGNQCCCDRATAVTLYRDMNLRMAYFLFLLIKLQYINLII